MAKHLTVGAAIEKNKISSNATYLILIDAYIKDEDGNPVTTLSFVKNSENIVWGSTTYVASNFEFEISIENNSEPSISVTAQDMTRAISGYLEAYGGCVGNDLRLTVINSSALTSGLPEIQETFKIISTTVNEYVVSITLGIDSAVNKRFPKYLQFKDLCAWDYKGTRCGYTGGLPSCDLTLEGTNGCKAHNNTARFGGFPGISSQ